MEAAPAAAEAHDRQREPFDLGLLIGDLALDEDVASDEDESLEGLQQELEDCNDDEVLPVDPMLVFPLP
ncbi:hypothetical protein E2562_034763 [Oryza meyeriana var. granulata]|uniref:Uncharacterized protein n=1 Tax=Oryza meyeriana var. granulata TaxID=110450 RepID=A0A6G1CKM9_9ORYZ|nr:hypothetical protein E2562_034763 [Oryza meyeriana var. granulata]